MRSPICGQPICGRILAVLVIALTVGSILGSIFVYRGLTDEERSTKSEVLRNQCRVVVEDMLGRFEGAVTISQAINAATSLIPGFLMSQENFSTFMQNATKFTSLYNLGSAQMLPVTSNHLSEWIADHPNTSVKRVDPATFSPVSFTPGGADLFLVHTCWPCAQSIGLDYLSEPLRREVTARAQSKRQPVVSMPITTTMTSQARSVKALVILVPRFANGELVGGVSMSYRADGLFSQTEMPYRITIFGEIVAETPAFAQTKVRTENTTALLDTVITVTCGMGHNLPAVYLLFLVGATILCTAGPIVTLIFWRYVQSRDGLIQQATEQRRLREEATAQAVLAREMSDLKSAFLANMSHEIRTPINAILNLTAFLLETDLDETQRDYASTIRDSTDALLSIINDVLDFSKIEAGKMDVDLQPVNLHNLLQSVAKVAESLMAKNGNVLVVNLDSLPEGTTVKTDAVKVRQVLSNLLSNAAKFTHSGRVDLTVRLEAGSDGAVVMCSVTDTGIGIDPDSLALLFQPFAQGDNSVTRRFGGTGLGLSISKSMATLLKGKIQVASTRGRGSTFTFIFPYEPVSPASSVRSSVDSRAEGGKGDGIIGGKILIVDDNALNLRIAKKVVSDLGYEAVEARNGQEALDRAQEAEENGHPFDVILMDLQMPVMGGCAATQELRRRGHIKPIVALTANALKSEFDKCLACGMDAVLTKPFQKDKLARMLAEHISKSRL